MIYPNDLMIGNLLKWKHNEDYFVVKSIEADYDWYEDAEPIPLAKEWFGKFEQFYLKINGGIIYTCEYNDLEINLNLEGISVWVVNRYDDNAEYINLKHIKYVHQLQNLHYILSSKHLTLKLNNKQHDTI